MNEQKEVYQLDENGFLAEALQLDPKTDRSRSGNWQIPFGCVEKKPPKEKEGYQPCWDGTKWKQQKISDPEEKSVEEYQPTKQERLDALASQYKEDLDRIARSKAILDLEKRDVSSLEKRLAEVKANYVLKKKEIEETAE